MARQGRGPILGLALFALQSAMGTTRSGFWPFGGEKRAGLPADSGTNAYLNDLASYVGAGNAANVNQTAAVEFALGSGVTGLHDGGHRTADPYPVVPHAEHDRPADRFARQCCIPDHRRTWGIDAPAGRTVQRRRERAA